MFGQEGMGTRIHDLDQVGAFLDVFQQHGHNEIDTARIYGGGTTEEYLGKTGWKARGLKLETKLYPSAVINVGHLYNFNLKLYLGFGWRTRGQHEDISLLRGMSTFHTRVHGINTNII